MRRILFVATVVMVLSTTTAAIAHERSGDDADTAERDCAVTDLRTATDCGERDRPSDRVTDRPTDRVTDRPSDRVTDRPTDRVSDRPKDRVTDRPKDRVTDRTKDRITDRPYDWRYLRKLLKRCLWHHIGDRPLPDDLTKRELLHLLRRCLAHHGHPGFPL